MGGFGNETNFTKSSEFWSTINFNAIYIARIVMDSTFITLGTLFNMWLCLAILTSSALNSRLRNKIIVSLSILFLTESAVRGPVQLFMFYKLWNGFDIGCSLVTSIYNIQLMQDFISNWTLVLLTLFYLAQLMDFKLHLAFGSMGTSIATGCVLALPWIASLVTVPSIMKDYHNRVNITGFWKRCLYPTDDAYVVFKSIDSAVPLGVAVSVTAVAVVLRSRRFASRSSIPGMRVELLSKGPEVDEHKPYVVTTIMSTLCNIGVVLLGFDVAIYNPLTKLLFVIISVLLSDARVYLIPFSWLMFADVRERLKTWRPWYRPGPGIDLTVTYSSGGGLRQHF